MPIHIQGTDYRMIDERGPVLSRFRKMLAFGSVAVISASCSVTGTMIPVEGPFSQMPQVPLIRAKADGILGNSGKLTFALPNAERCQGRWSSAAGVDTTVGTSHLIAQYGSAYLTGYTTSTKGGQNPGQALATCTDGRTFELEFVTGAGTAHGFGIGRDNKQNVYRFVF